MWISMGLGVVFILVVGLLAPQAVFVEAGGVCYVNPPPATPTEEALAINELTPDGFHEALKKLFELQYPQSAEKKADDEAKDKDEAAKILPGSDLYYPGLLVHFHAAWAPQSRDALSPMAQLRTVLQGINSDCGGSEEEAKKAGAGNLKKRVKEDDDDDDNDEDAGGHAHHKKAATEDEEEADIATEKLPLDLARIDCDPHKAHCISEHGLHTFTPFEIYPVFKLFWFPKVDPAPEAGADWKKHLRVAQYQGPVNATQILAWVRSKLSKDRFFIRANRILSFKPADAPVAPEASNQEEETFVIAFVSPVNRQKKLDQFRRIADNLDIEHWQFAFTELTAPSKFLAGVVPDTVRLFRGGRLLHGELSFQSTPQSKDAAPPVTQEELLRLICSYGFPSAEEFSLRTYARFRQCSMLPWGLLLLSKNPWQFEQETEKALLAEVGEEYRGKFQFAHQMTPHVWQDFATQCGSSGFIFPTLIVFFQEKEIVWEDRKMLWDESMEMTKGNLTEWLDGILDGTAKSWRRSLPLPKRNKGPVKIVVGFNFEEIVFSPTNDVFLLYHADKNKSPLSKNMEDLFQRLGELVKGVSGLTIAKVNALHNAFPENIPAIEEYPTIHFFAANDPTPRPYEGRRSLRGLVEYLKEHSKATINVDSEPLSDMEIDEMEDKDVKESRLGEDINQYMKTYTEKELREVNRQPKKEVRIPKNHPLYHYSTQHSHVHGPGGHHHHHHDEEEEHDHDHNEDDEYGHDDEDEDEDEPEHENEVEPPTIDEIKASLEQLAKKEKDEL